MIRFLRNLTRTRAAEVPDPSPAEGESVSRNSGSPTEPGSEKKVATLEPKGCEILIVDDEETSRELMALVVKKEGHHPHQVQSGREALRVVEEKQFDLILLDVRMPDISGHDVCRAIRQNHAVDELPILLITGYGNLESLLAGFEAGANDYLVKPAHLGELAARVKIHLSTLSAVSYRRRLRQAIRVSQEERELRRQLFEVRERERRRLAQELHDGPIQDLHAALALSREPDRTAEWTAQLSRVMSDLRSICSELRPPALIFGDLCSSLEIYVAQLQKRHGNVDFRLLLMADGDRLTEWQRVQFFRIGQEAMGNALQHGAPSRVELGFEIDAEGCRLWVQDDGCGFEVPSRWIELARSEHLGLIGISERAGAMGGEMSLETKPGHGTTLGVEISWAESQRAEAS